MRGIQIEVNKADVKRVQMHLKKLEDAPKHLRNAINRTTTQALKSIKQGRSAGYTVKAGRFNADIRVQRATAAHLDATIKSAGRPPTLQSFKTSAPKAGVKADITKSGLKLIKGDAGKGAAFMMNGLPTQRRTAERHPLKVLRGNSTPIMVEKIYKGERGGQGNMEEKIRQRLHEEMMAEIKKLM